LERAPDRCHAQAQR